MNTEDKKKQIDLLADCPPAMPKKLPRMIKTAISPLPRHIRMAGSNAIFPLMEVHLSGVSFIFFGQYHVRTQRNGGNIGL